MRTVSQLRRPTSSLWERKRPGGRWDGCCHHRHRHIRIGSECLWFIKCLFSCGQTVLEVLKGRAIPISLWILIGSVIGGLLLLALIIFVLWKVLSWGMGSAPQVQCLIIVCLFFFCQLGFFARKQRGEEENTED